MSASSAGPAPRRVGWLLGATALAAIAVGIYFLAVPPAEPPAPADPPASPSLTFNRDIAPILYENCVVCHRPGESAPFSLLSR